MRRLLTLGPDYQPLWVQLYVHPDENRWAEMIVGDDIPPPDPGALAGPTFFGTAPEEAQQETKARVSF
jgi:hypothetical protein